MYRVHVCIYRLYETYTTSCEFVPSEHISIFIEHIYCLRRSRAKPLPEDSDVEVEQSIY
jgi:hypothetical protein